LQTEGILDFDMNLDSAINKAGTRTG